MKENEKTGLPEKANKQKVELEKFLLTGLPYCRPPEEDEPCKKTIKRLLIE